MELIKDKNLKLFSEYEGIILNAVKDDMRPNKPLDRFVNDFIEAFRTMEERKEIKELTYQIENAIIFISAKKTNILKEIDQSYIYSSMLLTLVMKRANTYYEAINRIEEYYKDNKISYYLKEYKNL